MTSLSDSLVEPIYYDNNKQIMTDLEADLFAPRDSGSPPQEFLLTEAQPITRGTSHYLFYYTIMFLKGKKILF